MKIPKLGRPKLFNTKEEMENAINEYFESCFKVASNKDGAVIFEYPYDITNPVPVMIQEKPFTIEGLCVHIGMTRQSLLNYSKDKDFFDTIREAKAIIQAYTAERAFDRDGVAGAKFMLINNFARDNYHDRKEQDVTINDGEKIELLINTMKQAAKQTLEGEDGEQNG